MQQKNHANGQFRTDAIRTIKMDRYLSKRRANNLYKKEEDGIWFAMLNSNGGIFQVF